MSPGELLLRVTERLYRLLLLALPASFRREHGEETVRCFRDRLREAMERRGLKALPALWLRCYSDVVFQGLAERLHRGRDRLSFVRLSGAEVRQAGRGLTRSPSFSLGVVTTFGIALAAMVVVVALARGIFLHPFTFPSDDLLFVGEYLGGSQATVTSPMALARLEEEGVVGRVAMFRSRSTTLTGAGDPVRVPTGVVSHDYFDVIGRTPALGREFTVEEDGPGTDRVAVLSHGLWTRRFGADPGVLGRSVELDGVSHRIIGVMPGDFRGPADHLRFSGEPLEIWVTSGEDDIVQGPTFRVVRGLARLPAGTRLETARSVARVVGASLRDVSSNDDGADLALVPLREQIVQGGRQTMLILFVAAGLVLLVGCANVTNLVLARGLGRRDEMAVRTALGAGRLDLVRHSVLEVTVLGLAGGLLGLGLGHFGVRGLLTVAPAFPFRYAVRIEPVTVGASLALALASALLAGLVPALRLLRGAGPLLPSANRWSSAAPAHRRLQTAFAVSQVTLAAALLVGGLLLTRSFGELVKVERGYEAEGVWIAELDLPSARYPDAQSRRTFLRGVRERLLTHPSVSAVGYASAVPHVATTTRVLGVTVAGRPSEGEEDRVFGYVRDVSPSFSAVMGMGLVRGRMLEPRDVVAGRPEAVVVSETFAARFLDDEPVGSRLSVDGWDDLEVVGVVGDVKYASLAGRANPELYVPFTGRFATTFLTVRAADVDDRVPLVIARRVRDGDPLLAVDHVPSLAALEAAQVSAERTMMFVMLVLAGLGVVMASLGTYAVLAQTVSRRSREVGIRVALGASPRRVVGMVVVQAAGMVASGLAAGLLLAFWGGRIMENLLFGVSARDPLTYAAVAALLGTLSLAAAWLPARRAAGVDPSEVLRAE